MTFGLIVGLPPGFVAAQDLSTAEARAVWVIEQRRGEPIVCVKTAPISRAPPCVCEIC